MPAISTRFCGPSISPGLGAVCHTVTINAEEEAITRVPRGRRSFNKYWLDGRGHQARRRWPPDAFSLRDIKHHRIATPKQQAWR